MTGCPNPCAAALIQLLEQCLDPVGKYAFGRVCFFEGGIGEFPRTFRLALLDKDAGIAAQFAREQRVPAPMLQLGAEMFRAAHAELGEDRVRRVLVVESPRLLRGVLVVRSVQ